MSDAAGRACLRAEFTSLTQEDLDSWVECAFRAVTSAARRSDRRALGTAVQLPPAPGPRPAVARRGNFSETTVHNASLTHALQVASADPLVREATASHAAKLGSSDPFLDSEVTARLRAPADLSLVSRPRRPR